MRPQVSAPGLAGLLLAYCLLNLLFFGMLQPNLPRGDELLANRDFGQGLASWQVEGDSGAISQSDGVLTIDHPTAASTMLAQCWLKSELPQPLLLSAEARSEGVQRGTKSWHTARIDLVGYDSAGQGQYRMRTRLLNMEADHPWQVAQALFKFPPETRRVCLEISLYTASGRFQVRALSLTRGEESLPFRLGRLALLSGWLVLAAVFGRRLYRHYRERTAGRWLLLAATVVLAGILMPHELRQQLEAYSLRAMSAVGLSMAPTATLSGESPWALWPEHWDLSKIAHLLGFALLGVLVSLDRTLGVGKRVAALLLLALTSEILQFFVPLRTTRLSDLVVDALGIAIGMGLACLVLWSKRRSQ